DVPAVRTPIRRAVVTFSFAHHDDFSVAFREPSDVPIRAQPVGGAGKRLAVWRPHHLLHDALARERSHNLTACHVDDLNAPGREASELPAIRTPRGPGKIASV